jgi:hypothetical protein
VSMSRRATRPKRPRRMLKALVTVDLRPAGLSYDGPEG